MPKPRMNTPRSTIAEKTGIAAPSSVALSAQTVVVRHQPAQPNRALALLERHGETWRFVRAHLWFESAPTAVAGARVIRSRS